MSACCFSVSLKSSVGMDGGSFSKAWDFSTWIVSQAGIERKNSASFGCGKPVEYRNIPLMPAEKHVLN
jgi:hypothetical protein